MQVQVVAPAPLVLDPPHGRQGAWPVAENAPGEQTQTAFAAFGSSCVNGGQDSEQMPSAHKRLLHSEDASQALPVGIRHAPSSEGSRPLGHMH